MTRLLFSSLLVVATLFAMPLHGASAANGEGRSAELTSKSKSKPLKGVIYYNKRRGGYSYGKAETLPSGRAMDPSMKSRSVGGGPLETDFFFETPRGPFGGNTPYMH